MSRAEACSGKVAYDSRSQAARVAIQIRSRDHVHGRMQIYKCDCGKWHLGRSMTPSRSRR